MAKKTTEKIKPFFSFRKNRSERLDEALLAVLEAATTSQQLLAEYGKQSDNGRIDFSNLPMLWSKAAVQSRRCDKDIAIQCLYLAENFSTTACWDGPQVKKISQTIIDVFKAVNDMLD